MDELDIRGLGALRDNIVVNLRAKGGNSEEAHNSSTLVPLNVRIVALCEQGNWPQAVVSDKIAIEKVAILTQSLEMAADCRNRLLAPQNSGYV
jgi:hypothetical protein